MLFVCNHNAGRSQMAQTFFERDAPSDVRAESAGSAPAPGIWPTVVEAMRELGIDIAGRRPRKLLREMQLHADWAVTILARYDDVPVRSHILTLAHRQTRECLRKDTCDALAVV